MYKTKQRDKLIEFLKENHNKAYTASMLIDALSNEMNKATIYRKLKTLEDEGIIRKSFDNEKNVNIYEYAFDCHNHLHLQCIKCGKIIHLECGIADEFSHHIYEEHGFMINNNESTLYGICEECKI